MFPSSTKTLLYTQDGCGKCLDYQPLKDLDMERLELRKTTMDCVKNCGYDNLSLLRVMAKVFSLKSTPLNVWIMWVYIVWVETWCIRYDKLAKQNVSTFRVYLAGRPYLRDTRENQLSPFVMTLCIRVMC